MAPACSPLARALWAVLPLASPGGELWGEVPASFWEGGGWYQCALLSPGSEGPPSPPDGGRGASSLPTDAPLLGAGCQSTPQHGAVCGGQLGFQGIQCLRSPSRSPWLGVCDSLKWSQQLLLGPWPSSNLFSTNLLLSHVSSQSQPCHELLPKERALERVGGFQLLELLRVA